MPGELCRDFDEKKANVKKANVKKANVKCYLLKLFAFAFNVYCVTERGTTDWSSMVELRRRKRETD
jgi:hypothetical protein